MNRTFLVSRIHTYLRCRIKDSYVYRFTINSLSLFLGRNSYCISQLCKRKILIAHLSLTTNITRCSIIRKKKKFDTTRNALAPANKEKITSTQRAKSLDLPVMSNSRKVITVSLNLYVPHRTFLQIPFHLYSKLTIEGLK